MSKFEVRVVDDKPLKAGDELTFFYPSTEWDMSEGFNCECQSEDGKRCGQYIAGAKYATTAELRKNWLSPHICDLLAMEREDWRVEKPNL